MSDQRLRELQRRHQETGAVEDEVAYLLEAVRSGALPRNRLELASDLGHPAARQALGEEPLLPADLPRQGNLVRQRWGQWELVRLSLALARRLLPQEEPPPSAEGIAARAALDAVAAWVANPQTTRQVRAQQRHLSHEELAAWGGEPVAGVVQETLWAVIRPPYQGSPSTRGCEAMAHACEALGLEGMLQVLREDLIPQVLALHPA